MPVCCSRGGHVGSTGQGVTITTTAPQVTVSGTGNAAADAALTSQLNSTSGTADNSIPGAMNRAVSLISDKPFFTSTSQNDLARGFGDAGIYANQASTLQGYQDYDLFALSAGFIAWSQLPSIPTADEINNMDETVKSRVIRTSASESLFRYLRPESTWIAC
jgi:hypothetical protein